MDVGGEWINGWMYMGGWVDGRVGWWLRVCRWEWMDEWDGWIGWVVWQVWWMGG